MYKPVLTYQDDVEFDQLLAMYVARKPKRVLEVGSAYGGTLYHWLTNAQPGTVVVSVDLGDERMVNHALWKSWVPKDVTLHLVVGNSTAPETIAKAKAISPAYDFIFIDGGHEYDTVKQDWKNYGSLVAKGGLVAFDDIKPHPSVPQIVEVNRLWKELEADKKLKTQAIVAHPDVLGNGLGLVYG